MNSQPRLSLENNEDHQLILNIHQYIFSNTWIWIGFLGGRHEVCLATGSWSTSLPNHVEQQWDYIENYLTAYLKGEMVNPKQALNYIINLGIAAASKIEDTKRDPTTQSYYRKFFNYHHMKKDLSSLKDEFKQYNYAYYKK